MPLATEGFYWHWTGIMAVANALARIVPPCNYVGWSCLRVLPVQPLLPRPGAGGSQWCRLAPPQPSPSSHAGPRPPGNNSLFMCLINLRIRPQSGLGWNLRFALVRIRLRLSSIQSNFLFWTMQITLLMSPFVEGWECGRVQPGEEGQGSSVCLWSSGGETQGDCLAGEN